MASSSSLDEEPILGDRLGSGSYGTVYKATWKGQTVAVKRFHVNSTESQQASIKHEISLLDRLQHRHIIGFIDSAQVNDHLAIIMEYAEGGSLKHAIEQRLTYSTTTTTTTQQRQRDWAIPRRIALEIAQGLAFIHSQQVYHLDLKSDNVLLTADLRVRLCDFGLAAVKTTSSSKVEAARGTIRWMAPELFDDCPKYSTKSDVYALGMIMWEMAAQCTKPFRDIKHQGLVALRVMRGSREKLPKDVPDDYRDLVLRCWYQDSTRRPEAAEVALALALEHKIKHSDHMENHQDELSESLKARFGSARQTIESGFQHNSLLDADFVSKLSMPSSTGTSTISLGLSTISVGTSQMAAVTATEAAAALSTAVPPRDGSKPVVPPSSLLLPKDPEALVFLISNAAPEALAELAAMYESGTDDCPKNEGLAFTWYERAAHRGHARAQFWLARWYHQGRGGKEKPRAGRRWRKLRGEKPQPDLEKALEWYQQSAMWGCAEAYYAVAQLHDPRPKNGSLVSQEDALKWLFAAAERGVPQAEFELGQRYERGLSGLEASEAKAWTWYRRAAQHGLAEAQYTVGRWLREGKGQPIEEQQRGSEEATQWIRRAAEQGYAIAQMDVTGAAPGTFCGIKFLI